MDCELDAGCGENLACGHTGPEMSYGAGAPFGVRWIHAVWGARSRPFNVVGLGRLADRNL